ncbi:unnamed protein product [Closterium sp. NIES-54]
MLTYQVKDDPYIGWLEEKMTHIRMDEQESATDYCNRARRILAEMRMAGAEFSTASYIAHVLKGLSRSYNLPQASYAAPTKQNHAKPCREKQTSKTTSSMKDVDNSSGKGRSDGEASCSMVGLAESTVSLAPEASEDFQAVAAAVQANPMAVLLDSGCSYHLMGTKAVFVDMAPSDGVKYVRGFNGALQPVEGRGTIALQGEAGKRVLIPDVLYVPGVHANLLSAGQLKESGVQLQGDGDEMLLVAATGEDTFPDKGLDAKKALAVVHIDLCGPFWVAAKYGSLYFLLLKDCHTRFVWAMPVAKKSDVLREFQKWLVLVERQVKKSVLMLRTNLGGEFLRKEFTDFVDGRGIVHDLNAPTLCSRTAWLSGRCAQSSKPLGAVSTMAGPEERDVRGASGSGEAQAQGQPRDSAMAPVQPSLGPPRDEPRVFGLDKFNGDNFAEWSFGMENVFDHFDLLEVMEGTEKRPENDPEKSPWQASAEGVAVEGAKDEGEADLVATTSMEAAGVVDTAATTRATDAVAADSTASATIVTRTGRGAGGGRGRGRGGRGGRGGGAASMKNSDNESEWRDDRFPSQFFFVSTQAPAAPEKDESFEKPADVGKVTLHSLDYWVIDSGATYSMTPRAFLLTELEPSLVKHVTSALGQRAEVKGMGKAMFKGADGKMVGLKNVLWVPNLAANLISVRRLQKAGMDTSSKGAKTYTARLGERILWEIHEDRDVYNELWQIPVVPMPKERQMTASMSTKGEAAGSGDGANGRAKEIESKKCNLGGTNKLSEHEESGAAAKEQHKGEENPKAAAEEEYGESMWGTIASAAFSNPTSATGDCDWLTLHRRMGHVALPILQELVKNEMVAGIRVKVEPDEVLGCPTCTEVKFTRYPFSSSEATAKAPLDEVVMDVVGPLKLGVA